MKQEMIKTLALGAAAGIILMQLHAQYTVAGPQSPGPRVVPVTAQSIVPPSRMITTAVTLHPDDLAGVVQAPISLEPGEVFVLTLVSGITARTLLASSADSDLARGLRGIRQGDPNGPIVVNTKGAGSDKAMEQFVLPTGIRFSRLPNGRADLFLVGLTTLQPYAGGNPPPPVHPFIPADLPDVILHGYITTDF